jgi:hypothetical protein
MLSNPAAQVSEERHRGVPSALHAAVPGRGVDPQDAQFVLRKGMIYDESELDLRFQEWRYKVEGKPPDSEKKLKVVITFLKQDEVLVITVMLDKR